MGNVGEGRLLRCAWGGEEGGGEAAGGQVGWDSSSLSPLLLAGGWD